MTIRQIAETAGCGINTVRRVSKLIYPDIKAPSNGRAIDFSESESIAIMDKLPKSNYIADPTQMGNQKGNLVQNNQVDMVQMFQAMMKQQQDFMTAVLKEIREPQIINNAVTTLQLEHVPEKPTRAIFRQHIDKLVKLSNSDWSTVYNAVYSEMGYVYNVKIKARAKNRDIKPIDVLEQDGLMGKAIAITRQMIERLGND